MEDELEEEEGFGEDEFEKEDFGEEGLRKRTGLSFPIRIPVKIYRWMTAIPMITANPKEETLLEIIPKNS